MAWAVLPGAFVKEHNQELHRDAALENIDGHMFEVYIPKPYLLLSATCNEILSWIIEIWREIGK